MPLLPWGIRNMRIKTQSINPVLLAKEHIKPGILLQKENQNKQIKNL
jgi:hypothetical protein